MAPLQELLSQHLRAVWLRLASLLPLLYLFYDLILHVFRWQIVQTYQSFPHVELDLSQKVVANHPDPQYINLVLLGMLLTTLTFVFLGFMVHREKKRELIAG